MRVKPGEITILLQRLKQGYEGAADNLLHVVYQEFGRIAHAYMGKAPSGHTLQTTTLIQEAWNLGQAPGAAMSWPAPPGKFSS